MPFAVSKVVERLRAQPALVGPISGVDPRVSLQVVALHETLGALVALVATIPRVDASVAK